MKESCHVGNGSRVVCILESLSATYLLAEDLSLTHGIGFEFLMFTDLMQVLGSLTQSKRPNKRRLMIDVLAAGQTYRKFGATGAGYICGMSNPAEELTKLRDNGVSHELVVNCAILRKAEKWFDREDSDHCAKL